MRFLRALFTPLNIIGLLLLLAAGYAKQYVSQPPPAPPVPKLQLEEVQPQQLTVYYSDKTVSSYRKETRSVAVEGTLPGKLAQAAVATWLAGPKDAQSLRVVPAGSASPEVWLRNQHYIVNLPASYSKFNYGLSGEQMILCSLTLTLLEKTGQDVTFLVGGQKVATLLGHLDLSRPYTRADCTS